MNRRDLLSHPVASAAGQVLALLGDNSGSDAPAATEAAPLIRVARRAMATSFEVLLPLGTPDPVATAEAALDEIDRLEDQMTVYRDHSEVCTVNRRADLEPVRVADNLFELLQTAVRLHQETEGAFDAAIGSLIKAWGFFRGPRRVPSHPERLAALRRGGLRNVVLDAKRKTIHFKLQGVELNFGSIGKGYALDEAARGLPRPALLHGGHSSVLAVGCQPGRERGWEVGLTDPWTPGRRLGVVHLRDRALATSAATFQHLEYNGRKLGHILDPRTGWPAEGLASATVTAPTAAVADALATAFYILGLDKARAYCAAHPDIGAVLLPEGESTPELLGRALSEVELTI